MTTPIIEKKHMIYEDVNGNTEFIQPLEETLVATSVGDLVPLYRVEDQGRKKLTPVKLFPGGEIRTLSLQNETPIMTALGSLPAELIIFYESGAVRRLFPLNGKLSGYWSENDEYKLAKTLEIITPIGPVRVKPINIHFYETGELKSITFWPDERVTVTTPLGDMATRRGMSFHINGALASVEPANPQLLTTPAGLMEAFDPDPMGMNGEKNSLSFSPAGKLTGLATVNTAFAIKNSEGEPRRFEPMVTASMCSDEVMIRKPLYIRFGLTTISFRHGYRELGEASLEDEITLESFAIHGTEKMDPSCSS